MGNISRKEAIDTIEKYLAGEHLDTNVLESAIRFALCSIKADEMYQLDYEGIDNVIATEDMTNGERFTTMYPDFKPNIGIGFVFVYDFDEKLYCMFSKEWWNRVPNKEEK